MPTRYRITKLIGSGRSATVWLARDTRTGRDVAVKELHVSEIVGDPGVGQRTVERFETEVRSLGRLSGTEGVCRLIEVGVDRARIPWLVSEYMPGGSLASNACSLTPAHCSRLFAALAAAHEIGIVHGDISPRNILLDSDGGPVLADFEMAHIEPLVGTGSPAGLTPAFAAPERIRGGPATPASDVFALAASVLENLAVGDQRTVRRLRRAMRSDPHRRPSARRLGLRLGR